MLNLKMTLDGKIASVNKIYMKGRNGGIYLAPEVKDYRIAVKPVVEKYYADSPNKYKGGLLVVKVDIHTNFLTKGGEVRRIDIDNFAKQIIDSIFPPLNIDDKMIFDLRLRKVQYDGNPKAIITIKEIPPTSNNKGRRSENK